MWIFAAQLAAVCDVSDPVYVTAKPLTLETLDSTNGIVRYGITDIYSTAR